MKWLLRPALCNCFPSRRWRMLRLGSLCCGSTVWKLRVIPVQVVSVCSCNVTAICDTLIWRCLVQREVTVRHCCCLYRTDYLLLDRHGKCCCCGLSGARHSALFNVSAAGWSALGRSSVHVYVGSLQDAHVFCWEALDVDEGAQLGRHLQPGACEYLTMRGSEPHAADRYRWFSNGGLTLGMKCYMFVWNEVC